MQPKPILMTEEIKEVFRQRIFKKVKVDKTSNCWLWQGAKSNGGAGSINVLGTALSVRRVAYEVFRETIPEHLSVFRTCNNNLCINPDHAYLFHQGSRKQNISLADRFQSYCSEPNEHGCVIWLGCKTPKGYGHLAKVTVNQSEQIAHRIAYALYVGEIPKGAHVLHRCDVPSCVNPEHLFVGTNADNVADKVAKGRSFLGIKAAKVRLSERDAADIKYQLQLGTTQKTLADKYHVHPSTIGAIATGKTWQPILPQPAEPEYGMVVGK